MIWLWRDVLAICTIAVSLGYGLYVIMPPTANRWWQIIEIVLMGVILILAGAIVSSVAWVRVKEWRNERLMKQEEMV
jgi:uncharacterized membrane protein